MDLRKTLFLQLFLSTLTFSANNYGCCIEAGQKPPSPYIIQLQASNTNQTLVVRWHANESHLQEQMEHYELQIARPDHVVSVYSMSVHPYGGDGVHTLAWTSPLPLECADHSVRIRSFYDDSISSPWSQWTTNFGLLQEPAKTTRIYPFDQVMLVGTRPLLCCIPPPGANITQMQFNKVPYPLISIGDRVKAIEADNLTIPNGTFKRMRFSCTDSTTSKNTSIIFPSIPPEKPRNFSCETSDLKNVICTWEPGKEDYLLGNKKRNQTININLPNPGNSGGQYKCEESSCKFPVVTGLEEYHLSLLVSNPLGKQSAQYSFNISDRVFPVAKLYRVRRGVTEANVYWTVEGWLSPVELLCQVTLNESLAVVRSGSDEGGFQANMSGLLPNTLYSPRVRCGLKGKTPGKWSQSMPFSTYPLVTLDLWRRINQFSNNSRSVTLIWNLHVPGSAGEAVIQGYKIQSLQEGEFHTTWADTGQCQAEISIGPGQCEVTVQAVNEFSIPANITIPPVEAGERPVVEQQVTFRPQLSWTGEDWFTCGYTVEWCILGKVPCALQWMKLPRGITSLLLNPRDYKDGVKYTFNIYGCTKNRHKLLEIQTGYFLELKPVERPRLVRPVTRTSSSVTLEWYYNEEDPTHPGSIIGYWVTVKEVADLGSPGQTSELFNVSVMDPRRKWVTVEGLQEDKMYQFHLSALTKAGSGPVMTTTIKTSSNFLVYWVKILTPLAFLLSCFILLCHQRKT
ncbi:unnamed protein product [Lota lota]